MKFHEEQMLAKHMQPLSGSAIRAIFHLLNRPSMISFAGGNPALTALEPDVITELSIKALKEYGANLLQYGGTEGLPLLREQISEFVKSAGVTAKPETVLPTQGSMQALDLLLKALMNPGDTMLVESPTFLGALQTMKTYNVNLISMPMDDDGVIVAEVERLIIEHKPKLMYIIPTFQNPSGKTLPVDRRKALAKLANEYGVIIAEDDPYRDLRYSGEPLPSIKSFDQGGWVAYLGSFSKLISPALRVGYAVIDIQQLMKKMVIGKQSTDVHSPLLNQAVVGMYMRDGLLPAHIRSISKSYSAQLQRMIDGFMYWPEGTKYTKPEGGLFVWVELPSGINATELLEEAVGRGVAYVPGTHFYNEGGHHNTLRLNFSNSSLEQIEQGMRILGDLFAS